MRAVDLAQELGVDPKRLRQWLRDNFVHEHNAPWILSPDQERLARERFRGSSRRAVAPRLASPPSIGRGSRAGTDEAYVIDLCDEVLEEKALRQHRFAWLLGDPGASGNAAQLPVDAYYPRNKVVLEYRERQHFEPTPFFDRRATVSGVGRGEQRRLYDSRREQEIPLRGLRLIVIACHDLRATSRGRLLRDRQADRSCIERLLRGL